MENKTGLLYNDTVRQLKKKKRDVAQLGSAFVLGTKCHGFKSCHPYLLLLLWAVTRDYLRSIIIGHKFSFYHAICMQDVFIELRVQKAFFSLQLYLPS